MKKPGIPTSARFKKIFSRDTFWELKDPRWRKIVANWERAFTRLLGLGGSSHGNHVAIYHEGDQAFLSMCEAIDRATKSVWLEMYIFEPDSVGLLVRDSLIRAAKRGCEVILLYDHFGSAHLSLAFLQPVIAAGGRALAFNPIWPWRKRGPLLFRDHRKVVIIDNRVGFCGGFNISRDYAGKTLGNARFRDTLLKIEGPAVGDLASAFVGSLKETTGEKKSVDQISAPFSNGVFCQVLGSNTRANLHSIQRSMEVTLHRAARHCYFTTPYFLPYASLKKELIRAARRGVDIRVITAGLSDIPLMRKASQHVYGSFLESGIKIYEMFGQNLHAKTAVIDGLYSWVGSYNLDHWSARRNLELNVSVFDTAIATDMENQFFVDLESCQEVTMDSWNKRSYFKRFLQWISYQIMRL